MRKLLPTLVLAMGLFVSDVSAHEPGEGFIGSGIWKYVFFGAMLLCGGALLNRLVSLLPLSSSTKQTIQRVIGGALVGIAGYFAYHRFVE